MTTQLIQNLPNILQKKNAAADGYEIIITDIAKLALIKHVINKELLIIQHEKRNIHPENCETRVLKGFCDGRAVCEAKVI